MVSRTFPRTVAVVTLVALGAHAQPRPAPAAAAPLAPVAPAPVAPAPAPMTPAPAAPPAPVASEPSTPAEPGQVTVPRLHHAPPAVAPTHAPLDLSAEIDFPHLVRRAVVLYRTLPSLGYPASPEFFEGEFLRGAPGPYVAIIPAEAVRAPGLEYTIELELVDGRRVSVFASREAPHSVVVSEDLMDVREHAALERLGGRRSVVSTFIEGVDFGPSATSLNNAVKDRYYRVEAAYTYRPLRTVDEFSIRVGIVRGYSPVPVDSTIGVSDRYPVGLNYAAPSLRFRVADAWRLEGELLTSITELGFSLGAGGAVDVGDPYGSKLRVGFETVKTFGTRFFSQVDIQAGDRVRLSPIIEATDMPHADHFGVRLIGEVAYDFGNGFFGALRGGYQARDATSGGPSGGLRAGYAF